MLPNEVKENLIVGIIMASHAEPDTKTELIKYVRSHNDAYVQAAFRLGQMDMKMSAAEMFMDCAAIAQGACNNCNAEAAEWIKSLGVI